MFIYLFSLLLAISSTAFGSMTSDINNAIIANTTSRSLEEYSRSPFHPQNIFARARTNPNTWAELSDALQKLQAEDLTIFEEEIERAQNQLPHREVLQNKIALHWNQTSSLFTKLFPLSTSAENTPISKLRSKEVVVDWRSGEVLTDAKLPPKYLALTFDDGPHLRNTAPILKTLKDYGVRATFFEVGENVKALPETTRNVWLDGHTVGSHSWSHQKLTRLSFEAARDEILNARNEIESVLKVPAPFFRFPYGSSNKDLQQFLQSERLASFFWNIDSLDWQKRNPIQLFEYVKTELEKHQHGIILFHDIQPQTAIILPQFLELLEKQDYTTVVFVTEAIENPKP